MALPASRNQSSFRVACLGGELKRTRCNADKVVIPSPSRDGWADCETGPLWLGSGWGWSPPGADAGQNSERVRGGLGKVPSGSIRSDAAALTHVDPATRHGVGWQGGDASSASCAAVRCGECLSLEYARRPISCVTTGQFFSLSHYALEPTTKMGICRNSLMSQPRAQW
jgi:hypothetical protein